MAAGVPHLPGSYVPREALWHRLDVATEAAMTVVVAPAGAGKTLAVAGWLRSRRVAADLDVVWHNADGELDEAAMRTILEPPSARAGGADRRVRPPLVVIDDAHRLPAAAIRFLDARLNDEPQALRVLLLSRWDVPVVRLAPQMQGHLTILRGDVLRLADHECDQLIRQHARTTNPEVVRAITARADGWCAAVVLTARLVAASPDPVAAVERVSRGNSRVADQVADEVFAALSPRERHLLLCTAREGEVSAETAVRLTHDAGAGEVLDGLEATGLLVTRAEVRRGSASAGGAERLEGDAGFRVHPLLAEVVRRRIVSGGVDVERARSTVLRAVRLDVGRGETREAFRRLVDLGHPTHAVERLVLDGPVLISNGRSQEVRAFSRRWPEVIDAHPETWLVLALERWTQGDVPSAVHWLDRLVTVPEGDSGHTDRLAAQQLCARLLRARIGLEPAEPVVDEVQHVIDSPQFRFVPTELQPHLLREVGISQVGLGRLREAETNLIRAVRLSEDLRMPVPALAAMTHLACAYFMDGREHLVAPLAARALQELARQGPGAAPFDRHRAELMSELAAMSSVPSLAPPDEPDAADPPIHSADPTTLFWQSVRDARVWLARGSLIKAERTLQGLLDAPILPDRLRATLLIERALLAALGDDRRTLRHLAAQVLDLGLPGESALLLGFEADVAGDLRRAVVHFSEAAETCTISQPPCQALALTSQAQLSDALGDEPRAHHALRTALAVTEVRGNFLPFLGWSRRGTPMHVLLRRLDVGTTNRWRDELMSLPERHRVMVTGLAPTTTTVSGRASGRDAVGWPALSPRELDVLHELARGATYADIAAGLYVSENTVKTHVSSLYSKLGAGRRSEALSTARRLELL